MTQTRESDLARKKPHGMLSIGEEVEVREPFKHRFSAGVEA